MVKYPLQHLEVGVLIVSLCRYKKVGITYASVVEITRAKEAFCYGASLAITAMSYAVVAVGNITACVSWGIQSNWGSFVAFIIESPSIDS